MRNKSVIKKIKLKGGSLSGTYLCTDEAGDRFVRKEVSLVKNREYGFQRWYSQLKRLQRYQSLFPGLFPRLYFYAKRGGKAYFDIEYIEESETVFDFLRKNPSKEKIDTLFETLISTTDYMHSRGEINSNIEAIDLYIYEEVVQKMQACMNNKLFKELAEKKYIYLNGQRLCGLYHSIDQFKKFCHKSYVTPKEVFTHGNMTLENILYQPKNNKIIFIDPYEENIIDSKFSEYSQILQSTSSHYEIYNSVKAHVDGNLIDVSIEVPSGIEYFNGKFESFIDANFSSADMRMIRLFEVSQYARMLPFKMEVNEEKMALFYAVGSNLFHKIKNNWSA